MAGLKVLAKTSQKISIGADTFRLKVGHHMNKLGSGPLDDATYQTEFSPGLYGVAPRYALKKNFDTCHYALKSSIRFNLISDTAWC